MNRADSTIIISISSLPTLSCTSVFSTLYCIRTSNLWKRRYTSIPIQMFFFWLCSILRPGGKKHINQICHIMIENQGKLHVTEHGKDIADRGTGWRGRRPERPVTQRYAVASWSPADDATGRPQRDGTPSLLGRY